MKPNFHKRNKEQRSRPHGLSLEAFTNAKQSGASTVKEIRKRREFYQNAKKVQNYRKLLKRLGEDGNSAVRGRSSLGELGIDNIEQAAHASNKGQITESSNINVFRKHRPRNSHINHDEKLGCRMRDDSIAKGKKRKAGEYEEVGGIRVDWKNNADRTPKQVGSGRYTMKETEGAEEESSTAGEEDSDCETSETQPRKRECSPVDDCVGKVCGREEETSDGGRQQNDGDEPLRHKKQRRMSRMARELKNLEERKAEQEAARRAAAAAAEEKRKLREAKALQRKDMALKMRKKTRKGQPVMKHRMDKLLDQIRRQS